MKVVLDIETIQVPKDEWARLKGITLMEEEKVTDLLAAGEAADLDKEYEKSCFESTYCQIICIGLIVFSDAMDPQESIAWYGSNERDLLQKFWDRIGQLKPVLFITHNGLGFDLPIIRNRSMINQVKPAVDLPLGRYRMEPVYDTLAVWSNWEARGRIKLDVLARALGCETKSGDGGQVADMWRAGEGKALAEYCLRDCYVTYACYCKMTFRNTLGSDKVLVSSKLIDVTTVEPDHAARTEPSHPDSLRSSPPQNESCTEPEPSGQGTLGETDESRIGQTHPPSHTDPHP